MQTGASVHVRRVSDADAEALWDLRLVALETDPQAFRETAEHHRATPVAAYRERLRSGGDNNAVFGAYHRERLIGMAGIHRLPAPDSDVARIWGMFVLPEYRGLGAGGAVLTSATAHARLLPGIKTVELSVAATQEGARRLYVRHGFEAMGCVDDVGNERMALQLMRIRLEKDAAI